MNIYPETWYNVRQIYENGWLFGKKRKFVATFFARLSESSSYAREKKTPLLLKMRKGNFYNSTPYIKGESLTRLIKYVEQNEQSNPQMP